MVNKSVNKSVLVAACCLAFVSVASADSLPFFFYEDGNSPASPHRQMQAAKPSSASELFAGKLDLSDASAPFAVPRNNSARAASGFASDTGAQGDAIPSAAASDDFLREKRGGSEAANSGELFASGGHFSDFEAGLNSGSLGSSQNSPRFDSGMFFHMDSGAPGHGHGDAHHGNGNGKGNGNNNGNGGNGSGSPSSGSNPEIVSTPEPSSLLLLAFGAPLFLLFYESRSARRLTNFTAN